MSELQVTHSREVLSGPGGPWAVDLDLQKKLCLTDDHVVHVVTGYGADPFVLAFVERLRRSGIKSTTEYVLPEFLKGMYQGASQLGQGDAESAAGRHEEVVKILRSATEAGASDVHFSPTPNGHQLLFRIHGELEPVRSFTGGDGTRLMSTAFASMSESKDTNYRSGEKQDGRMKPEFVTECGLFGARLATRPTQNGPWMVMRLLYDSGKLLTLDQMGYLPEQIEALTRLVHRIDGIVLLTGTTGSGKSTSVKTLLSMLLLFMKHSINLATVEDPVEYRIEGANQTSLAAGEAWAETITNLMRLDPDVLFIGEIRDMASALAAFQAALTGHGFWSTLHVNRGIDIFQRLHDLGVEDSLLYDPSLVKGLVNQSLARVLCAECKVPYAEREHTVPNDLRARIETHCKPAQVFVKGDGCACCGGRGIVGRTAIAEIIEPNLEFMHICRDRGKSEALSHWVKSGGITKNQHLIRRINEGLVDPSHGERDASPLDEDLRTLGAA